MQAPQKLSRLQSLSVASISIRSVVLLSTTPLLSTRKGKKVSLNFVVAAKLSRRSGPKNLICRFVDSDGSGAKMGDHQKAADNREVLEKHGDLNGILEIGVKYQSRGHQK